MTSQKRYRHHEGHSASRFRDIPPRFKRQKSSSSPKPEDTVDNQENEVVSQTQPSDLLNPGLPQATMAPSNKGLSPTSPKDSMWSSQSRSDSHSVLAQMDNNYPISDWAPVSTSPFQPSSGFSSPPLYTWQPQPTQVFPQQPMYSYQPMLPRSDCLSPSLQMAQVRQDDSMLALQTNRPASVSPLVSSMSPASCVARTDSPSSSPDYSDPDIRTIEMLRELERVADQKEKEDENDPTVDRKNLVSHHLRMLMCAVDRYTEGVEDEEALSPTGNASASNTPPKKREANQNNRGHAKDKSASTRSTKNFSNVPKGQQSSFPQERPVPQSDQGHREEPAWQTVVPHNARKLSRGKQSPSPVARPHTPQTRTPPPPTTSPTRTPPPAVNNGVISNHRHTSSPYVQQQQQQAMNSMIPLRAVTRYNNDQGHVFPSQLQHQAAPPALNPSCSPLPFSPAHSPPQQRRNVWGPMSLDQPGDSKSWDIWSGPSFVPDIYGGQRGLNQCVGQSNSFSAPMYPYVPYAPVDLKEQMPLYRR